VRAEKRKEADEEEDEPPAPPPPPTLPPPLPAALAGGRATTRPAAFSSCSAFLTRVRETAGPAAVATAVAVRPGGGADARMDRSVAFRPGAWSAAAALAAKEV